MFKRITQFLILFLLVVFEAKAVPEFPQKQFVVIRHGETDRNIRKKTPGASADALNEHGRDEATKIAPALRGIKISAIISSPLERAYQTATILNNHLGDCQKAEILIDDQLIEKPNGFVEWVVNLAKGSTTPIGPRYESSADFKKRIVEGFKHVLSQDYGEGIPVIVTHSGVIKALARYLGLPLKVVVNAQPLLFTPKADGTWEMEVLK